MTRSRRGLVRFVACAAALTVAATAFALDPALRKQAKDGDAIKRADAARGLAKDGTAEAASILAELFEDKNASVRDIAVLACASLSDAAAIDVIAKAAATRDELTRRNVAAALGRTKNVAALPALTRLARKDASAQVRADAIDALWGFEKNADALAAATDALGDTDAIVRAAAAEAAGRIGGAAATDVVRKALTDPDEGVRCVARMEMRAIARDEALALLASGAADPSWRIRAQTVDDAAWLRDAAAIEALVKLVGDPVVRVSGAAHRALLQLSGKDLGRDAALWSAWWGQNKDAWKAPHTRPDQLRAPPAEKATTVTYYGLDVTSERVAFVMDFSASMKEPVGGGDGRPRWDVAKEELRKAIAALPDGTAVNVLLSQLETKRCFDRATPLAPGPRKEIEGLLRLNPGERGNLLGTVLEALSDDGIDAIFLLSDGDPSAGDMVEKPRVQAAIRQVARMRKVAIHAIGFGAAKATERAFLEGVARDSGGVCVFR